MFVNDKTAILTAQYRASGVLDSPVLQHQHASRASRIVDDSTRYLLISFDKKTRDETIRECLRKWVLSGVTLKENHYTFLGFTESHIKQGRIVFFREDSAWTVERLRSYLGPGLQTVFVDSGYGKYAARLGLLFSSTVESLNVPDEQTVLLPPWLAQDGSDHTDGCGMISDSFAAEVCKHNDLPTDTTVFQIRRGGIKGLLARYPDHKFETFCSSANGNKQTLIAYRKSMLKYEGGPTVLELNDCSRCPGSARLNVQFILLLLTLGVGLEVFERLLKDQLDLIGCILHDREKAERYIKGELDAADNGYGQDLFALLLAKHDLKEPYVEWKLKLYQQIQYNQLRNKMSLRVEDSCYVYGVVDEDGILEENEVFIKLPARAGVVVRDVLVGRNPAYSAGDLRKFRAVNYETLKYHKYCIVFSRKAAHSIPDTMSSGDLDGDMYFVTWDPTLIPSVTVPPRVRPPAATAVNNAPNAAEYRRRSERIATGMEQAAIGTFMQHKFSALLGTMVNEWKTAAQSTSRLANAEYATALVSLIETAHDMLKTGSDPQKIRRDFFALRDRSRQHEDAFTSPIEVLRKLIPESGSQKMTGYNCDPALILRGEDQEKWKLCTTEAQALLPEFNRALTDAIELDKVANDQDDTSSRYQDRPIKPSDRVKLDFQDRYFGGGSLFQQYLQKIRASAWYWYGYSEKKRAFAWLGERYLNNIRAHWTNGGKPVLYVGCSASSGSPSRLSPSSTMVCEDLMQTEQSESTQSCSAVSGCITQKLVTDELASVDANPRPKLPVASMVSPCTGFQGHDWSIASADQARRCYICETCNIEVTERKLGKSWVSEPIGPPRENLMACKATIASHCSWKSDHAGTTNHMSVPPPIVAPPSVLRDLTRVPSGDTLVDDSDEAMSMSSDSERSPASAALPATMQPTCFLANSNSLASTPHKELSSAQPGSAGRLVPPTGSSTTQPNGTHVVAQLKPVLVCGNRKPSCPVATPHMPRCRVGTHRWKCRWANGTHRQYTCLDCEETCKERHSTPDAGGPIIWVPCGK